MKPKRPKLNEVYAAWSAEYGFFASLYKYLSENGLTIPEWIDTLQTAQNLDYAYHGNFSGNKTISNFVNKFVDSDGYITDTNLKRISGFWYSINAGNIARHWEIHKIEYNPIENYSMSEEIDATKTGTDTITISGKETEKNTGTQKLEGESSATGSVFGLDSTTTPAPADKSDGETESTRTDDLTREKSYTDRNNETEYDTNEHTETTRTGNIGTLTSQQMIQSDLDVWKWNFYNNFLFPCADNMLTIPLYL